MMEGEQVDEIPPETTEQASLFCRNTLAMLIKHNLVKAQQGEYDLVTYYSMDSRECLLRLSIPRYFVKIRS
jgi:hypothetical protein